MNNPHNKNKKLLHLPVGMCICKFKEMFMEYLYIISTVWYN